MTFNIRNVRCDPERGFPLYPLKAVLIGNDERLLPNVRRELANQDVEIEHEFPDIQSTIEHLSLPFKENRLFVCKIDRADTSEPLRRLSGAFAKRPIIALIEQDSDASFVVRAMRDGAAQLVMLPFDIADFHNSLASVALQFGHSASESKVIAVSGAHGGAGATTLAVNLGYEFSHMFGVDTVVADLSLHCGVLASYLAIDPKFTTLDLLQNGHEVDLYSIGKALVPFSDKLSILGGPSHAAMEVPKASETGVSNLIDGLRKLASIVVLDVPSTLDGAQMSVLHAADEVVLVADQTVPSLQLTKEFLRLGLRNLSLRVVINRYDTKVEGMDASRMGKAISIDGVRTISLDQVAVMASVNCGQPLRLVAPKSKAVADIHALAQDLYQRETPRSPAVKTAGLISTLGHAFGLC